MENDEENYIKFKLLFAVACGLIVYGIFGDALTFTLFNSSYESVTFIPIYTITIFVFIFVGKDICLKTELPSTVLRYSIGGEERQWFIICIAIIATTFAILSSYVINFGHWIGGFWSFLSPFLYIYYSFIISDILLYEDVPGSLDVGGDSDFLSGVFLGVGNLICWGAIHIPSLLLIQLILIILLTFLGYYVVAPLTYHLVLKIGENKNRRQEEKRRIEEERRRKEEEGRKRAEEEKERREKMKQEIMDMADEVIDEDWE